MLIVMYVENLCHIIITPCFQFYMDFATFEITMVKFPISGINLCILHPSFPSSVKNGGKINNRVFRKGFGRLFLHKLKKLKGMPVTINNPYLIWMKVLSFD